MDTDATWARAAPAPALRKIVDGYVGYRLCSVPPGVHRGLPSARMTFIVSVGAPIDVVEQTNRTQAPGRYRAVVGGLQATSALIAHGGIQEGVVITLSPLGCTALFDMPAAELWELSAEVSSVRGRAGDELWERVQHAPSWGARFAACDRVLLTWLGESRVTQTVASAWGDILAADGRLSVDELARRAGYSRQHFTRLFRRELGLGPKVAGRVVRFDRAVSLLRHTASDVSLSDVAQRCGFVDQAHLCREFTQMAGCTPRDMLTGAVPIVAPDMFQSSKTCGIRGCKAHRHDNDD